MERLLSEIPRFALVPPTQTKRSDPGYGNGLNSTPLTTEKIDVFVPMPSASARIATIVKPGLLMKILAPYFRSCQSVIISLPPYLRIREVVGVPTWR